MTAASIILERQQRATTRNRNIRVVLWLVLGANWLVAGAKLAMGLISGSTAMTSDGLPSLIDGGSNVIGLVAMHYASLPPDADHPYGHQKFEALASLAIGAMVGVGVVELGRLALNAIVNDVRPEVSVVSFLIMLGTLVFNLIITKTEHAWGKKLGSSILLADAKHTLSDVFVTLGVIASLGFSYAGIGRADGVAALAILGFVAWTGWTIIRGAVGTLAHTARIDSDRIRERCLALADVADVRDVRSRGMEGQVYVDLKIEVDPSLSIHRAHVVSDAVEELIVKEFPDVIDVVVHVEPQTARKPPQPLAHST